MKQTIAYASLATIAFVMLATPASANDYWYYETLGPACIYAEQTPETPPLDDMVQVINRHDRFGIIEWIDGGDAGGMWHFQGSCSIFSELIACAEELRYTSPTDCLD